MKNLFDYKYDLVCEGGAAGHMAHPFDLPIVKTPVDIVKFFDSLTTALKKDEKVFMKIDGVNASVRLNDKGEFVLDRMSMKPLDVIGVTKDDLVDRFGAGHGFLKIGAVVLDIFNEALPTIQQELKMLGMNGGKRMLNIEYVEGTTNVIETDKKFIAIHGLLDIIQATPKKRVTKEVSSYNKGILNKLIAKVNVVAEKYGFAVYNQFLAMLDGEPDYKKVLAQDLTINLSGVPVKKSVADWVMNAVPVSSDVMVVSKSKGKIAAVSKYVLQYVLDGGCISDDFQGDSTLVLSGFLMYYLTMILGAELLRCINSDLGRGDTQEGIVIRNAALTGADRPVKITGSFILKGMSSKFRLNEDVNEGIYGNLGITDSIYEDWVNAYNKQLQLSPRPFNRRLKCVNGRIRTDEAGHGGSIKDLVICDDSILDNGDLPADLPLDIYCDGLFVEVYTDKLKSFTNFPHLELMDLYVHAPISGFNTISSDWLGLHLDSKYVVEIANVKSKITYINFAVWNNNSTPADDATAADVKNIEKLLRQIKGCKFVAEDAFDGVPIHIDNGNICFKTTDAISDFLKNNKFVNAAWISVGKIPDLKFLDVPGVNFKHIKFRVPDPQPWYSSATQDDDDLQDAVKDFLVPVGANSNKFTSKGSISPMNCGGLSNSSHAALMARLNEYSYKCLGRVTFM